MKVLHVSIGGMILRAYFSGQLKYLSRKGHTFIVAAEGGSDLKRLGSEEGCLCYSVDIVRRINPVRDIRAFADLCRIIRAERPDVVQCHTPKAALLGLLAAARYDVPIRIYHLRTMPVMTTRGLVRLLLTLSEILSSRLATNFLSISSSLAGCYANWRRVPRAQIVVLGHGSGNGVDVFGRFNPERISSNSANELREIRQIPDGAKLVVFIGRLTAEKGIVDL